MNFNENDLLLVTGATGLVGSHVAERARKQNIRTRALVRATSDTRLLEEWGVEKITGDLTDCDSLRAAVEGVTVIVHCAAKVGDWGPIDGYRRVNVEALEELLILAEATETLKRFVHISSLGVYEARDHHGTDETEQPSTRGIDGYTLTKVEAERLVEKHIHEKNLPATILRPGFIYGPRDRTVLPRLLERIKNENFAFLGSNEKLMNNTYVINLVDAIFAAIANDETLGRTYNISDGKLVTKKEFIATIANSAGYKVPERTVPLGVARLLANVLERVWKLRRKQEAPVLSHARIKFLGLNLDFCIDKAKREFDYQPHVDFSQGMRETVEWFREQDLV